MLRKTLYKGCIPLKDGKVIQKRILTTSSLTCKKEVVVTNHFAEWLKLKPAKTNAEGLVCVEWEALCAGPALVTLYSSLELCNACLVMKTVVMVKT